MLLNVLNEGLLLLDTFCSISAVQNFAVGINNRNQMTSQCF